MTTLDAFPLILLALIIAWVLRPWLERRWRLWRTRRAIRRLGKMAGKGRVA